MIGYRNHIDSVGIGNWMQTLERNVAMAIDDGSWIWGPRLDATVLCSGNGRQNSKPNH